MRLRHHLVVVTLACTSIQAFHLMDYCSQVWDGITDRWLRWTSSFRTNAQVSEREVEGIAEGSGGSIVDSGSRAITNINLAIRELYDILVN